jgi:L-Ala-D/L-Glu epimerase
MKQTAYVYFETYPTITVRERTSEKVKLKIYPYTLELRDTFTISTFSRNTTPAVIVELEHEGITGYGEASMPPYLGESIQTVTDFLSSINFEMFEDPFKTESILHDIDLCAPGNTAAKASVDIALHDWIGKKTGYPLYSILGLDPDKKPLSSFTIGIGSIESVRKKVLETSQFPLLKIKLGSDKDKEIVETIRELTDRTIRVDVNQGWSSKEHALQMIEWLALRNVELIEQPLPADRIDDLAWLRERSSIPIIGDEGVKRITDVSKAWGVYDGINVKLMKSTGIREAYKMIITAKALGMKVMIGCMTETSCAISAASQLSPLADWADLDGAMLIKNDVFNGAQINCGKITIPDRPGIGIVYHDKRF